MKSVTHSLSATAFATSPHQCYPILGPFQLSFLPISYPWTFNTHGYTVYLLAIYRLTFKAGFCPGCPEILSNRFALASWMLTLQGQPISFSCLGFNCLRFIYLFLCIPVCCLHVHQKRASDPITDGVSHVVTGIWTNSGPLEVQPSLQPPTWVL